jgi:MFS family permease
VTDGGGGGHPQRWLALAVLCLTLSMIVIDNTILTVALPSLARELHADETDLQWIATSYGLVLAGLLLPLAVLGDRYGRKGLLLVGLTVFGAASGTAAFATSPIMLSITRGAMGIGGACAMPATLSILGNVFDEQERGRAIAIWSGIAGIASAAGPIAGGLLLARFWWGSIFLVNVPLAVIAIGAAVFLVPNSRDPAAHPLDRGSARRWWAALTAALVAIIEGPQQGWTAPVVIAAALAAIVLLGAFVHRERVSERPLIPRETARDPRLRWGAVTMSALFFAAFGVQFVLTQWLQGPRHKSAMGAALYFLPNAAAGIVAALRNPRWVARFGQGAVAAAGLAEMAAGAALTAVGVAASSEITVLVAAVLVGLGIGTSAASGAELIMSSAAAENAGAAAGVNETIVEAAGALGVAVLGTVFVASSSYAWPLPVGAGVAFVAAIAVFRGLSPARRSPNRRSRNQSLSGRAP